MISVSHLSKTYHLKNQDVVALNDVDLTIQDGEIFGVIGYSGAGKSTLVRCLNLLEKPDFGDIKIDNVDITRTENGKIVFLDEKKLNQERKKIGMIFQHFNLFDRYTVFDNIAYPLRNSGLSKQEIYHRVIELLDIIDLKEKINVYPSQLSGGQKQRVAIARAIANKPKVLLSDEATSALDPEATESILQLLAKLNRELGLTIILITHEMSVIKKLCHRVAVMEEGKVVEVNDTYELFADPKAEISKRFVNSTSSLGNLDELIKETDLNMENGILVKLTFMKDSVGDAVISAISRNYQIDVDIILANVELLQAGVLGKIVAALKGEQESILKAIEYLKENQIKVEVIEHVN